MKNTIRFFSYLALFTMLVLVRPANVNASSVEHQMKGFSDKEFLLTRMKSISEDNSMKGFSGKEFQYKGDTYRVHDNYFVELVKAKGYGETVVIPMYVFDGDNNVYVVDSLGKNLFKGNKIIETVTIPSTVVSIRKSAFMGCPNLVKVKLGANVSSIGSKAFYNCKKLKSIVFSKRSDLEECLNLDKLSRGTVGNKAFSNISESAIIKVPSVDYKLYKNALSKAIDSSTKIKKY